MTRKRHFVKHIFVLLLAAVLLLGTITAAQAASAILTKQPMDASAVGTGTVNFTVDASGSNLTYQWQYKNPSTGVWKNCSSATKGYNTDTLTVAGVSGTTNRNGYQYRCVVTSGSTKLTSNAATLTVYAIKTQPESATVDAGETADFRVVATGSDLSYQWQYRTPNGSWKNCSSATKGYNTDTLTVGSINGKTSRDGYHYRCVVTSGDVKLTSKAAKLTVAGPVIEITSQPQDAQTVGANKVSFTVKASGNDLSYQWQYKKPGGAWKNCSSATQGYNTDTLTVAGISGSTNRNGYQYRCVITSGIENLASDAATLTVTVPAPTVEITVQPKDARAEGENKVSFTVKASGSDLSYQWQYKKPGGSWKNCSSATQGYNTDTLTVAGISGATNRNGYQYRCVVSSGSEMDTSKAATLTVTQPVSVIEITSQPQDAVGKGGDTAVFRIKAVGEGLTYQWQYSTDNGESWINASSTGTSTSCKINKTSNGRLYRCVITDSYGTQAISDAASLTWIAPISIVKQPADAYVAVGDEAVFTVELLGAENWDLTYSWQSSADNGETWTEADGAVWISDDGNQTTVTTGVDELTYGRLYRCVITDETGASFTSKSAKVIESGIRILEQPQDALGEKDEYGVFKVAASGSGLTYQWQYSDDEGDTWVNASSTKTSVSCKINGTSNGRLYRCVLTDSSGAQAVTDAARLIWKRPLSIVQQPKDAYVPLGGEAFFDVEAVGWNLNYEWEYSEDGGETWLPAYRIDPTLNCDANEVNAARLYRCVVTNGDGEKQITNAVAMHVIDFYITAQPEDAMGKTGDIATFTVTAEGYGLTYQWQYSKDGGVTWTDSSTKQTATCTINRTSNGWQYRCIITDRFEQTLISDTASITWIAPITIVKQPTNASVLSGDEVTFTVQAEGWNLSYSWEYSEDGGEAWNETGCTDETFSFEADNAAAARQYRCVITDGTGEQKITRVAKVTLVNLRITAQPEDATGKTGDIATFTVTAEGYGLTYQWQYTTDGGETWTDSSTKQSATCTINRTSNGRQYRCIITDKYGQTVISDTASITWIAPITIVKQPADVSVQSGDEVTFTVQAEGWNLSYSWEYSEDGGEAWNETGCTAETFSFEADDAAAARQYRCVITDGTGEQKITRVTKVTLSDLQILTQPQDALGETGDIASFKVTANGVGLTYQWQYSEDGGETWVNSATKQTATCTINRTSNGRLYRCIVTDSYGKTAISNTASVIWMPPLKIVKQPVDAYGSSGSTVEFTVKAEGWNLSYSWEYSADDGVIWTPADCTEATISCTVDDTTVGRRFRCIVTDGQGNSLPSSSAQICSSAIVIDPDTGLAYYIVDGNVKLTGWQRMEDGTRYFDDSGSMARGVSTVNGKKYYFDWNTGLQRFGLIDVGAGHYMYFDETTGNPVSGLKTVDGVTYYFSAESGLSQGGFETVGGSTYYFDRETYRMVTGMLRLDDKVFYFGEDGKMLTGLIETDDGAYYARDTGTLYSGTFVADGKRYCADDETYQLFSGFYETGGTRYYFDGVNGAGNGLTWIDGKLYNFRSDGSIKTGLLTVDGTRYFFDLETGEAVFGLVSYGGRIYGLTENGVQTGLTFMDGALYDFSSSGYAYLGLQTIDGDKYYFDTTTGQACNGWKTINGIRYYFEDYKAVCGQTREIDGVSYTFTSSGAMKNPNKNSGCVTENGVKMYYDPESGERQLGFVTLDGNTFYYTENGLATGLLELEDGVWYFDNSCVMRKGLQKIGDNVYYFDLETGRRCSGLVTTTEKPVYADPETGVLQSGFVEIDGKEYYFRPNVFTAQTGWLTLDSTRYYFDAQGVRRTGFVTVGDYTYYVDESGTRTGLSEINGSTYCFSNSGYLLYGARTIDDKAYFFDTETGAMRTGLVELNGKWYGYLPEGGLAAGYHDFDGKTYFFTEKNNQLVLGLYSDKDGNLFNFDLERGLVKNDDWIWEGVSFHADSAGKVSVTVDESNPFSKLMARGVELLGTPYGKGEGQLVCSSLVHTVMQAVDVDLPETVNRQYTKLMCDNGVEKDFDTDALRPGDAVFYLNGKCGISDCHEINEIHHVGIYLGGGKMLEATSLYYNDELEDADGYTLIRDITNTDDIFVVMVAHLM